MGSSLRGIGIPVKLLHESIGHVVTIELKNGEMYRGELTSAEDNWNCQLRNVLITGRDGRQQQLEHIFLRGSRIRFLAVPDMLKNAPMFKRIDPKYKNKAFGVGHASVAIAKVRQQAAGGGGGRGRGRF